ncbi:MAG: lysophospholipid acyltransferase family protein [bacterium]
MDENAQPTLRHRLEYVFLKVMEGLASRLPRPLARALAWKVALLAFDVLRIRRGVTLDNLLHAFPDEGPRWRRRVGRRAYFNLALVGLEMLQARRMDRERLLRMVDIQPGDEEVVRGALAEGRGAVLVGGHYGNWELMAARTAQLADPSVVIVQDQRNPLMDRDLKETRRRLGLELVGRGAGVRRVLKTLKGGGAVMMLADQDAGTDDPMWIEFFGRPASAYRGPAAFCLRSGAPMVGGWIHREGDRYVIRYRRLDREALGPLGEDAEEDDKIQALSEAFLGWLEECVREDPTQYLWLHRRWKSQPPVSTY